MVVTSLFGAKVKIDPRKILKQTKTIQQNNNSVYSLHLSNNQILTLKEPLDCFPLEVINAALVQIENKKSVDYDERKLPPAPETSNSTLMVSSSGRKTLSKEAYRGEMVWTHKTAPEIRISKSNGLIVKDVDIAKMYKRR